MKLTDIGTIKDVMERHGLAFQKKYGQNFLISESVPQKTAQAALDNCGSGARTRAALEIGPGIGTLTCELCRRFDRVCAVEIDSSLLPALGETLTEFDNFEIINSDVLKVKLDNLVSEKFGDADVAVCANLPYYITTPILMYLLESGVRFTNITVMVQREVADRLCAKAGSAEYGAITASIAYRGKVEKLFGVPAGCFYPAPKVDSAVVRITLYDEPAVKAANEALLFDVIKAAFAQRRKTLVNALSAGLPNVNKELVTRVLTDCNIDEKIRGEKLDIGSFARISDGIFNAM
ncbi:MAG: 16S rRNA (adenine(1518)-N(6)/adenine(1519)-N(6))-dimethyltransferase RsmA [Clostridia bacterium]|nr:16S rRNA (adenine(1518)-N(6)/adenine(1519)-N(6))-dimethyltransferase RsmA [Clostridia bacterium]